MNHDQLTQDVVKRFVDYNPETGVFTWLLRQRESFPTKRSWSTWNARFAGKAVGAADKHGYLHTTINYIPIKLHRLAFLCMLGRLPDGEVDHINGITNDNRWVNLRDVSHAENGRNTKRPSDNSSGVVGVSWSSRDQRWMSSITKDGETISLGYFKDFDQAVAARRSAEAALRFHPNHGRTESRVAA